MFGDLVRAHRRRLGMTQEELADRAGVSVRSVGKWESGRIGAPRPPTVRLLAAAFGLAGADREHFFQSVDEGTPGAPAAEVAPAQLPPAPPGFTGRDVQLARLTALLAGAPGPAARAVVISAVSGGAGVGKPNPEN